MPGSFVRRTRRPRPWDGLSAQCRPGGRFPWSRRWRLNAKTSRYFSRATMPRKVWLRMWRSGRRFLRRNSWERAVPKYRGDMPGKVAKIGTFSDWEGMFNDWRKDIGVNTADIEAFHFDTLYGAIDTEEIEFGSYKGRRKWENLRQIPTQQMRDALMNMIVYQGDTEFASVEQQRNLLENAPTDWDRRAITRVMIEEMR